MRPICFVCWSILSFPAVLTAQDPAATALQVFDWPESTPGKGVHWSVFSRQYYGISNWNATGVSAGYSTGAGQSTILICRDGIPGFSWYHLYVSHKQVFKSFDAMLQLRFSLISLKEGRPLFRIGGNFLTDITLNSSLLLRLSVFDFPGWILPGAEVARSDPAMQFLLFHETGRMIGLAMGFRLGRSQFGPLTTGISMKINDRIGLFCLLDVVPLGFSTGISYQTKAYQLHLSIEYLNGLGTTPTLRIDGQ